MKTVLGSTCFSATPVNAGKPQNVIITVLGQKESVNPRCSQCKKIVLKQNGL